MNKKKLFFFILSFILISSPIFLFLCQATASESEKEDAQYLSQLRVGIKGTYYGRNLPFADGIFPLISEKNDLVFFNPRFVKSVNDKGCEGNFGIGLRHLNLNENLLLGINTYFDRRKS